MSDDRPTYADARKALLEAMNARRSDGGFSRKQVIQQAAERLGRFGDRAGGRLLMDAYDDLFRSGIVGNGLDMANLDPPWAHVTEHGAASLKNLDRDPANPGGYLTVIDPFVKDQPVSLSYLVEALETYNKGSVKAAAVMLGCAAEALTLALRDRLKAKMQTNGATPPAALDDWRIAVVLRTVETHLDGRVSAMPRDLRERFESYWPAFTGLYRMTRNDVGHPKSVDPVTRDAIHGALLLFHEHARLMFDIALWIDSTF